MARGVALLLLVALACGCGEEEVTLEPMTQATAGLDVQIVSCAAGTFQVAFDPARQVTLRRNGRQVAFASFEKRSADGACGRAAHRRTLPPGRTSEARLGAGIYRRVELECAAPSRVRVTVHAILDGNHPGKIAGSTLGLETAKTTIVGAVLKNKGDPNASRVYRAPAFCRRR
jgi:hypothetical protein